MRPILLSLKNDAAALDAPLDGFLAAVDSAIAELTVASFRPRL
jgi:hypothetical protein